MKSLSKAVWWTFCIVAPWAMVLIAVWITSIHSAQAYSPAMKQHYSMNWLEMEDPFTGKMEVRTVRLPTKKTVDLCSTVGCQRRTLVGLSGEQLAWSRLVLSAAKDAAAERRAIAKVIAYLELYTCGRNSTCNDSPNVTAGRAGQMDCVDESTNSTSYMLWMQLNGLLKFHKVQLPQTQGFPVAHWFAVIRSANGGDYIVESDFNRPGQEPVIQRR